MIQLNSYASYVLLVIVIFHFVLFKLRVFSLEDRSPYVNEAEPHFTSPILNVTVAVGRDAQLPCVVENLGSFKVAWLRVEDKGILTIHDHVITRNYRINLIHTEEKQFTLLIKNIQPSDAGGYMCQINTVPMKSQVGYIEVVVPPQILDASSSTDVIASEGSNVTLTCKATGHPQPQIQWKREDRKEIPLQTPQGKKYVVQNMTGESMTILRVTRVHMGALLCIASNGIQPSVSRRVFLRVQFPPAVWLPTQAVSATLDQEVVLSCHIEAFPSSVNYWIKESSGKIIESNDKYRVLQETKDYKTHLILTIRRLQVADLGLYTCLAKNSLGAQEGSVKIHEIHGKSSSSSSSSSHRRRQYKGKTTSEKHSPQDSQFYGGTKTTSEDGEDNNDGSSFTSDSHSSHFLEDVSSTSSSPFSPISSHSSTFVRDVMIIFSVRGIFPLSFRILHKVFSLSCICYPRIVYRLSSRW